MQRSPFSLWIFALVLFCCGSCAPLALRSPQKPESLAAEDAVLEAAVAHALHQEQLPSWHALKVRARAGEVTLKAPWINAAEREQARAIAGGVRGVRRVILEDLDEEDAR